MPNDLIDCREVLLTVRDFRRYSGFIRFLNNEVMISFIESQILFRRYAARIARCNAPNDFAGTLEADYNLM